VAEVAVDQGAEQATQTHLLQLARGDRQHGLVPGVPFTSPSVPSPCARWWSARAARSPWPRAG
jgi:hypothetical protein